MNILEMQEKLLRHGVVYTEFSPLDSGGLWTVDASCPGKGRFCYADIDRFIAWNNVYEHFFTLHEYYYMSVSKNTHSISVNKTKGFDAKDALYKVTRDIGHKNYDYYIIDFDDDTPILVGC